MKPKRILSFLLSALILTGCLVSCAGEETAETVPDTSAESVETEETGTETEPVPEEEEYVYSHVVIIGCDGAGSYFRETETPRLDEIMKDGAIAYDVLTAKPSISAQCWGSLLTGLLPEVHGFSNQVVSNQINPADSDVATFFRTVHEKMPDAVLASICHWSAINIGIIEDDIGVHKENYGDDNQVTDAVVSYVAEEKPALLFVHFDASDAGGHTYGFGSKEHLDTVSASDALIGRIYDAYADAGMIDDTLFIVTADHGGDGLYHGGWTDTEKYVMFAAAGRTVAKGSTITDMAIRDTAAVVLHAFGLDGNLDSRSTARVPNGLFEGYVAEERRDDPALSVAITHESEPTPEIGSGRSLLDLFSEDRVIAYFPFDGNTSDAAGKIGTTENGKLYFTDGYFGSGIRFDDGYISLQEFQPDTDSFTVGFWVYKPCFGKNVTLVANKSSKSDNNPGFRIKFEYETVSLNIGAKKTAVNVGTALPAEIDAGWTHILLIVDRENARVGFTYNFGPVRYLAIDEEYADISMMTKKDTVIGNDAMGFSDDVPGGTYDEFFFLSGTVSDEEIAAMKAVYFH